MRYYPENESATSSARKTANLSSTGTHKPFAYSKQIACKNSKSFNRDDISFFASPEINLEIDEYTSIVRQKIVRVLSTYGIVVGHVTQSDPEGTIFKQLVEDIGEIDAHDKDGKKTWDIKYDPSVKQGAPRSHTLREFEMHTDASFELPPPKYICLYVVREDAFGGGVSQLIEGRKLLTLLSNETKQVLHSLYRVHVPDEFYKDHHFEQVPILDDEMNFRFRRDIIIRESCTHEQLKALRELETLLSNEKIIESKFLPAGTMLFLDNGKFLHARTEVKDKDRHLLRMRFQPNKRVFDNSQSI